MRPPPGHAPASDVCREASNREIRRKTARRINYWARRISGVTLMGWQVRSVAASLIANREEPTDEQIIGELMRAPWFPKPRIRKHQVGDPGWRTRS